MIRKGSFWSVIEKSGLGSWMWKKLLHLRPFAAQLTKMEVDSGSTTSFWFDNWSQLGRLIEITGERGCIIVGIPLNYTVERVVHIYKARRHRTPVFFQIEQEILALKIEDLSSRRMNVYGKERLVSSNRVFSLLKPGIL